LHATLQRRILFARRENVNTHPGITFFPPSLLHSNIVACMSALPGKTRMENMWKIFKKTLKQPFVVLPATTNDGFEWPLHDVTERSI
jgi:hypothetical protein